MQLIIAERLNAERKAKVVFNCTENRAGSNTEDPIKEKDSSMQSNICHSVKPQSRDSRYRDLKSSAHLVWIGSGQWGVLIKQ